MAYLPPAPSGLSGGDTPGAQPLTLGAVQFNSIEVPNNLAIGALQQHTAVVELIGGGRVVQSLGNQPKPLAWSGHFWGANVATRIAQLSGYATSGAEIPVVYLSQRWYGVVRDFTPTYDHRWHATYHLQLEITRGGATSSATPPTTDAQVDALNAQGQALVNEIIANAQAKNTQDLLTKWLAYLAGLAQLVSIAQSSPSALLPTIASLVSLQGSIAAFGVLNQLNGALGSLSSLFLPWQQLTNVVNLSLANIRSGQAPRTITVRGGSSYEIAAQVYGDVTQAFTIAQTNAHPTPWLSKTLVQSINLPAQPATA